MIKKILEFLAIKKLIDKLRGKSTKGPGQTS